MKSKKANNQIVIRPRFKLEISKPKEALLDLFETISKTQKQFIVSRVDDHVFIEFPKIKQTFWSPQLHIEVNDTNVNQSVIYGLFDPNPTLWL